MTEGSIFTYFLLFIWGLLFCYAYYQGRLIRELQGDLDRLRMDLAAEVDNLRDMLQYWQDLYFKTRDENDRLKKILDQGPGSIGDVNIPNPD